MFNIHTRLPPCLTSWHTSGSEGMSPAHRIANTATSSSEMEKLYQNPCLVISHRLSLSFMFDAHRFLEYGSILVSLSNAYLGWLSSKIFLCELRCTWGTYFFLPANSELNLIWRWVKAEKMWPQGQSLHYCTTLGDWQELANCRGITAANELFADTIFSYKSSL